MESRIQRAQQVYEALAKLSASQFELIENIIEQLTRDFIEVYGNPDSDIISPCMLETLGDSLRIHHCFSKEPLSKDRFEYAVERASNLCGVTAVLAPRGNPGHDITINNERFSLKTEAARGIKKGFVHISKFMELGRGAWDLDLLRARFLVHINAYERVVTLRCLSRNPTKWHYELVEIPKPLLLEAENGQLQLLENSRQTPRPGYCYVRNSDGSLRYRLYFDGGTERKLQIQLIQKSLCIVHAQWIFRTDTTLDDNPPLNS